MKQIIHFIAIIMLSISALPAQDITPFSFEEDIVRWSDMVWMDGQDSDNQRFVVQRHPILIGDTIYTYSTYSGYNENGSYRKKSGYLIEKRNVHSGERYWKHSWADLVGKRRYLSHTFLKDGDLVATTYEERFASAKSDWHEGYASHFVLDRQTGEVVDSTYGIVPQETPTSLRSPTLRNRISEDRLLIKSDTGYLYFAGIYESKSGMYHLNDEGLLYKTDTTLIPKISGRRPGIWSLLGDGHEFNYVARYNIPAPDTSRIILYHLDEEHQITSTVDLTKHFEGDTLRYFKVIESSKDHFMILTGYEDFDAGILYSNHYLFDNEGNLKDVLYYCLHPGVDNGVYGDLTRIIDVVNERIIISRSFQKEEDQATRFELFVSEQDSFRLLSKFHVKGTYDHFRTQKASMMPNGDIFLYTRQFNWDSEPNFYHHFSIHMLDGRALGIVDATDDPLPSHHRWTVYPNPTSGKLQIQGSEHPSRAIVRTMDGRIILQSDITHDDIYLSSLPNAPYLVEIVGSHHREVHKVIKIE